MKILQIANDYLGTKLYYELFKALECEGVKNVIFVPILKKLNDKKKDEELETDMGSALVVSPCFTSLDRVLYYSKQRKINDAIHKMIDISSINCIHAHTLFSAGYTAMKLKEEYGIPYIVAIRNVDVNIFFKRVKHLRSVGAEIMRASDKIVFLSPAYKETVLNNYVNESDREILEKKTIVIPNGISDLFHKNIPDADAKKSYENNVIRILYAGEINQNKNLSETIKACKLLKKRGYTCYYTVVGDVTDHSCSGMLQEDFIIHYPKCNHEELLRRYRENDIFVMTSHTETFGLVYAEAMSQGLPVIYTRGQGFDGHFENGVVGYNVSDNDAEELAEKIQSITEDESTYNAMRSRCIKESRRFDWGRIGVEYKDLYETFS